MRREAQNIELAFDVLSLKLSCLIRFSHLIFETNVVERVNSGQISLVVTYVPLIVHVTIGQFRLKFKFLRELSNLKQI